jgi:hypothetical protein
LKEENVDKIRKRRIVILSSVILLLVIWIVVIRLLNNYFVSSVDDNWEQIKSEKIENQNKICQNLFDKYLRGVTDYSNNVSSNLDIRSSLFNSEQTKLFDNLLKLNLPQTVEVEIFNKRIETVTYSGRHIEPDFLLLKKAMDGKPSLILKEFGFYNYLVNFIPIKDISNESINIGVLVCAYQIDYNPQIKNNYFQPYGLSYEINNILNVGIKITSVNNISSYQEKDTNSFINFRFIDLTGFDGSILGKLKIPNYEKTVHINSLIDYSSKIQSVLIFLTSILLSILFLQVLKKIDKISMKVILVFIILILIRYLWILFEFPNKLLNTDIFSPSFYAVSFSFGMLKSLGDLFITSLFIFVFCIFLAVQVQRNVQPGDNIENNQNKFWNYIISFILVVFSFLITYLFGLALHSIIYDSNIKFLDLTEFLPNAELLFIQLVIVIFAFSYMLLLTSSLMKIYFHLIF